MLNKKYPTGTKIRFLYGVRDKGKIGNIVGIQLNGNPIIFLPTAHKHIVLGRFPTMADGTKFTWKCQWREIEQYIVEGEQLLFDFMYKEV